MNTNTANMNANTANMNTNTANMNANTANMNTNTSNMDANIDTNTYTLIISQNNDGFIYMFIKESVLTVHEKKFLSFSNKNEYYSHVIASILIELINRSLDELFRSQYLSRLKYYLEKLIRLDKSFDMSDLKSIRNRDWKLIDSKELNRLSLNGKKFNTYFIRES
jgi:hypothetical protein